MAKTNEIIVPIGGAAVQKFGLEFKAIPINPSAPKKGRGKRRPCRVEVVMDGKTFSLEPAHGGYDSSKFKPFGHYLLRFEGTAHVNGVGAEADTQMRVAVITWREISKEQINPDKPATPTKKTRTSFSRMDRRAQKRVAQRADLD